MSFTDYLRKNTYKILISALICVVVILVIYILQLRISIDSSNRQLGRLILTNRQLVGVQRLLISNFAESYNILTNCTILLEDKNCDQMVDGQRLERLKTEKENLIGQMNKLDGAVEDIIEENGWSQYTEDR